MEEKFSEVFFVMWTFTSWVSNFEDASLSLWTFSTENNDLENNLHRLPWISCSVLSKQLSVKEI